MKFISRAEAYRILQRESPEGLYPDNGESGSYSAADYSAFSSLIGDASANLSRIFDNYFPQYTDESVSDWEIKVFGYNLDASLTLAERRTRIIEKIRSLKTTTIASLSSTIASTIGASYDFEIVEWGCVTAGWTLDYSQLDISTILNGFNRLDYVGPDLCSYTASDFGLSEEDYLLMREEAYTYEVRIYGATLSLLELKALDKALLEAEPARSQHIIVDGVDPNDKINGGS